MKGAVTTLSAFERVVIDNKFSRGEVVFRVLAYLFVVAATFFWNFPPIVNNAAIESFQQSIPSVLRMFLMFLPWLLLWWLYFSSIGRGYALVVDREGISGVAIAPKLNRLPWSRLRSYEIDGGAVVLDFEPADLLSDKPADRISKTRLSMQRIKPEEIAVAIEKFWTSPQRG